MPDKIRIKLDTIDKVHEFTKYVMRFDSDINIIKGRVVYDAKSILGVFKINPMDEVCVEIISDDEEEIERFNNIMSVFRV